MNWPFALLFAASLFLPGCQKSRPQAVRELPTPSANQVEETQDHPGVVLVRSEHLCSGAAIGPSSVLTAAHCLVGTAPVTVDTSKGPVEAKSYLRLGNGDEGTTDDLAILYLEDPTFSQNEILPIGNQAQAGDEVVLVGFGCNDGTLHTGSGVKRAGTNVIFRKTMYLELSTPASKSLLGPENRAGACLGDSGGPLLKKEDGAFKIVGISHSAVPPTDGSLISRYTDLTNQTNREWVISSRK